jgi:predicted dehydrogenase
MIFGALTNSIKFMKIEWIAAIILLFAQTSCLQTQKTDGKFHGEKGEVKIIQLNPTHSHAAVAQNVKLEQVDTNVYVYSPEKEELKEYFQQINSCNSRKNNPTNWNLVNYSGPDYLQKMIDERKGNVVVLSGNNKIKIDYIEKAIDAGFNVFSDKPMVINKSGFNRLKDIYPIADKKGVLMFDMMTERYTLINIIQRLLMQDTLFFGRMQKGTSTHPAIMESSVHHFYRGGKGNRPSWFFDVEEQGEGIVDVTTHLIDLTMWKSLPEQIIDYNKDIKVLSAEHWPVRITKNEFSAATSRTDIPESLKSYMKDSVLEVFSNGTIVYQIKGINAGVKVEWRAATPKDGNDLRSAYAEGTKATLLISQEYGQKTPAFYAIKSDQVSDENFQSNLKKAITRLSSTYPGITLAEESGKTGIILPAELESKYDPTFKVFLDYLVKRDMPGWEVPNTLAKYYITTTALEMAKNTGK